METTKQENAKNEAINLQADTLIDLPVADEQADEMKGGPVDAHDYLIWRRQPSHYE